MSLMEVIRSEGPLKKDWEVTYRAGHFCDESIEIKELKDEGEELVVEKDFEFFVGGMQLKMRGCTLGQMTNRTSNTIGKFLGMEKWTRLWDAAVKKYKEGLFRMRYFEIMFAKRRDIWKGSLTEITDKVEAGGLWYRVGTVGQIVAQPGVEGYVVLETVKEKEGMDDQEVFRRAKASGVVHLREQCGSFGGDEEERRQAHEALVEFVVEDEEVESGAEETNDDL